VFSTNKDDDDDDDDDDEWRRRWLHLPMQLVSRSWSRTVGKLVKSCTRMTLFLDGILAVAFSSVSLTESPIPSATIFVCVPPDMTLFSCVACLCHSIDILKLTVGYTYIR